MRTVLLVSPSSPLPGASPSGSLFLPGTSFVKVVDDVDVMRKRLRQNWRGHLNKAEHSELTVADAGIATIGTLVQELAGRKGFDAPYPESFFATLGDVFRDHMSVRCAFLSGEPVAGWLELRSGGTATYLAGATNEAGRRVNASYLLAWDSLKRCSASGVRFLDLGGAEADATSGPSYFKSGMGGVFVEFPGTYVFGPRLVASATRAWMRRKR